MSGVRDFFGTYFRTIHLEASKGTAGQNREYCTKDGDFEEFGRLPSQGRRSDLSAIKARIEEGISERELATEFFGQWVVYRRSFSAYRDLVHEPKLRVELKVFALIGRPGIGKTRFAFQYANRRGGTAFMSPDPSLKWFDGYGGEDVAILDDYRGDGEFAFLLRLLDIYPLRVQIKGGFVNWEPKVIFITSNKNPEAWHPEEDYPALRRRIARVIDFDEGPIERGFDEVEKWALEHMRIN